MSKARFHGDDGTATYSTKDIGREAFLPLYAPFSDEQGVFGKDMTFLHASVSCSLIPTPPTADYSLVPVDAVPVWYSSRLFIPVTNRGYGNFFANFR